MLQRWRCLELWETRLRNRNRLALVSLRFSVLLEEIDGIARLDVLEYHTLSVLWKEAYKGPSRPNIRPLVDLLSRGRRGGSLQCSNQGGILTLLREFKACVVVTLLEVALPMAVEGVNDALRVHLASTDDVALILRVLIAKGGEAALHGAVHEIQALLQGVRLKLYATKDVLLPELVLVAHVEDALLRLAATVLELLHDVEVAELGGVDDALRAEADLPSDLLDGRLYATDGLLQLVEVAVEYGGYGFQAQPCTLLNLFIDDGLCDIRRIQAYFSAYLLRYPVYLVISPNRAFLAFIAKFSCHNQI